MDYPAETMAWLDTVLGWAKYLGASVCVLALLVLAAMTALDRNRGEAGIASSDQSRFLKLAFGIMLVAGASSLVAWFLDSFPG